MKKLVLILFLAIQWNLHGQSILNGAFEDWTSTNYDIPNGWFSSNDESLRRENTITTTKVTGQTGFAIKLETKIVNGDTLGGYFTNSIDNPLQGVGGVPYSQQPTSITGYYQYNLQGNDTAILLVVFKKNGTVISSNIFMIRGTGSQSSFLSFSFPLSLPSTPDSVIIAAASGNLLVDYPVVTNGSYIIFDNLAFGGAGITQPIPGGDFDNWTAQTHDMLNDWASYGNDVTKTTDKYKGTYAVVLETIDDGGGFALPSGITSGVDDNNGSHGGHPFTNQIDTLFGYYKYTTPGVDSAFIVVNISKNSSPVGGGGMALYPAATYTYFEIPLFSAMVPDTMRIDITSSYFFNAVPGSKLIIDEVQLKSQPLNTGLPNLFRSVVHSFYPNPVKNELNIYLDQQYATNVTVSITDINGKAVASYDTVNNGKINIPSMDLKPGMYFYTLQSPSGVFIREKFVKE